MSGPGLECVMHLHRFQARLRLALDRELAAHHGIDLDDFVLLQALASDGAMSLASLGDRIGAGRASVLKRTRPLEKIGLIATEGALAQRRVSLAPGGRRLLNSAEGAVGNVWNDCVAHLPAEQVETLSEALDRIEAIA